MCEFFLLMIPFLFIVTLAISSHIVNRAKTHIQPLLFYAGTVSNDWEYELDITSHYGKTSMFAWMTKNIYNFSLHMASVTTHTMTSATTEEGSLIFQNNREILANSTLPFIPNGIYALAHYICILQSVCCLS